MLVVIIVAIVVCLLIWKKVKEDRKYDTPKPGLKKDFKKNDGKNEDKTENIAKPDPVDVPPRYISETKRCQYCMSYIDKRATVCPVCHKRQYSAGSIVGSIFVAIILLIFLVNRSDKEQIERAENQVNYGNFTKISTGMSYDEVCDIFGKEGKFGYSMSMSLGTENLIYDYYYWYAPDGGYSLIAFVNNEVIVSTQVGLEK